MKKHNGITNSILDLVGDTPLVRLNKITKDETKLRMKKPTAIKLIQQ